MGRAADRSGGRGRPCLTFALARTADRSKSSSASPQPPEMDERTSSSSSAATFAPFSLLCRLPTFPSLDGLLNGLPPPRPSSVLLRLWRRNGDENKKAADVGDLLYILLQNTLVHTMRGFTSGPISRLWRLEDKGQKDTYSRAFSSVQTVDSQTDFVR